MALKTKGTVKVTFSRKEMFESSPSNWPVTTHIKTGAKRDGTIVAQQITLIEDTGASLNCFLDGRVSGSGTVCVYDIPNVHMDTYGVNTNTPPVGPYRGLGCPQSEWAVENQVNLLAHELGMSPVEIRRKNILERGANNAYGETVTSIGLRTCLELVADAIKIDEPCLQESGPWIRGKGIAVGGKQNTPLGRAEAKVAVHSDGSVELRYSADENGMGSETVMAQIVAEELKIPADAVKVVRADTLLTPYDNFSASSRTTYTTGKAVLLACRDAVRQLREAAARRVGVSVDQVEVAGGKALICGSYLNEIPLQDLFEPFERMGGQQQWGLKKGSPVVGHGIFAPGPCILWDEDGRTPRMWNWYQYNACAVEAAVNVDTGRIKVLEVYSASDMGFPINPKMCEGQIEGGVGMAIGFAVNEEYLYDEQGRVLNGEFLDYRVPTAKQMPERKNFRSLFGPDPLPEGPYGAKGLGEAMMIPVAPAIAAAVHQAVGIRPTVLPMSAERILALLKEKERGEHT
jgi:carbon-monoxide dehydrogenase large subunit